MYMYIYVPKCIYMYTPLRLAPAETEGSPKKPATTALATRYRQGSNIYVEL